MRHDVEELLAERGIEVDHVTVYRWVQRFTPLFADAARFPRHSPGDRWFVDETYVKVNGIWRYVYRARLSGAGERVAVGAVHGRGLAGQLRVRLVAVGGLTYRLVAFQAGPERSADSGHRCRQPAQREDAGNAHSVSDGVA